MPCKKAKERKWRKAKLRKEMVLIKKRKRLKNQELRKKLTEQGFTDIVIHKGKVVSCTKPLPQAKTEVSASTEASVASVEATL